MIKKTVMTTTMLGMLMLGFAQLGMASEDRNACDQECRQSLWACEDMGLPMATCLHWFYSCKDACDDQGDTTCNGEWWCI